MKNLNNLDQYRKPLYGSMGDETCGYFEIPHGNSVFRIVASCEDGWDHVSVTIIDKERCPKWIEMCFIKDLFFDEEEAVMQIHPPKSDYINNHPYCLHLWKPNTQFMPLPPSYMVGFKALNNNFEWVPKYKYPDYIDRERR